MDGYPPARRVDVVDVLHGVAVPDPYRWLEDPDDPDTRAWLAAQDALARPLLDALPGRDHLRSRLTELLPGTVSAPAIRGDRRFFLRREPGQDHAVLFVEGGADAVPRALVDPNALSAQGIVTLDAWYPSKEGGRLAYELSEGGDEETVLRVLDVATGEVIDGPISRTKYGSLAWMPRGDSFFYVRRLAPGAVPAGEEQFHRRIWHHRVGADPEGDLMVFGEGRRPTAYYDAVVSADGRWLLVVEQLGTAARQDVWIADLEAAEPGSSELPFVVVQEGHDSLASGRIGPDGRLWMETTRDAPRTRLVVCDPADPAPERWVDVVPEDPDAVLADWTLTEAHAITVHTRHAVSEVRAWPIAGGPPVELPVPGLGVATVSARPEGGSEVWIGYDDFTTPFRVLHHDLSTGRSSVWAEPPGTPDLPAITVEQVAFSSPDGTTIHMFVIRRAGLAPDPAHPRPTILYGYGGFLVSITPGYSDSIAAWVEAGGVYAVANIRGGAEEGEEWHRDGMRERKQHVFDDFAAAAEHLVALGWTDSAHLAVSGGSNGGLLVGATLTQRPDVCAAVVCVAPLLDMVRYESFSIGRTWNEEYGTADDPVEFGWLHAYSPYHHVVEGTRYPAVLFVSFDADSRTDPLHARKMCAAVQAATASPLAEAPVLFRREADVGHAARSIGRTVELGVDTLSFLASRLGLALP